MQLTTIFTRRRIVIILVVAALVGTMLLIALAKPEQKEAVDPNQDKLLNHEDGTTLYNAGNLYQAIGQNDDVFRRIEEDITLFGRTTRPEFKDPNILVGFTFNDGFNKDGETSVYTGRFQNLNNDIEIRLTAHGRGVYTLSITNLNDHTNIDDQLSMNGKRNAYIRSLPIEKDRYSIRYQLPFDRIVVSFYDNYTDRDIDAATGSVRTGIGYDEGKDVVYSLNRIGIVSLEQVRQNLVTPLQQP